ncbi:MAG: PhoPQ-activated protein PqaA family protein [Gemmataceae bacterium]
MRLFLVLALVGIGSLGRLHAQAPPSAIPPELSDYVTKPDDSYKWSLKDKIEVDGNTVYTLDQISQTWHGIVWDHGIIVVVPKDAKPQKTMLLLNTGGKPNPNNSVLAVELAKRINAPVAFLFGIPKQPLYNGKTEDALISETFVRYLETKDGTWPLLFPMAKSVVKTMDTLQAFAKKEWNYDVTHFVVTGASKRGWTSWLTAASGDKRVKAIAPMVIDTLNFKAQMPNQLKSFNGKYSEMIHDYEERKLLPLPDTNEARRLWAMVDPWVYRDKLTLPKMLIHGTNDPYWAQDAMNIYWDDLKGEKHACYVPNAGHGLTPEEEPNKLLGLPREEIERRKGEIKRDLFPTKAINTLAAFAKSQIEDKPMPNLEWKKGTSGDNVTFDITVDQTPVSITKWTAVSDTPDFRKSKWMPEKVEASTKISAGIAPSDHYKATMFEYEFASGNRSTR